MGVNVGQLRVMMDVRVRFAGRIGRLMRVLVMLIVPMQMLVRHCFVVVLVGMPFGEMQ